MSEEKGAGVAPMVYSCKILAELRQRVAARRNFHVLKSRRGADVHNTGVGTPGEGEGRAGIDSAFLALERELSVFLRRARANSGEMAREVHPDLEPAAYGLLARLNDVGQVRATDLASYFGVGKATMSRQLRALETLGLIARAPDPDDGRAWLVQLTEEGRTRFTRVRGGLRARYAQRLEGWNRAEVAELARLLHRLNSGHEPDTAPESLPGQDTSPEPAVSDQQPEPIPPEPTV